MKSKKAKAAPWFKKCNLHTVNCCVVCKHICSGEDICVTCVNPKNNTNKSLDYYVDYSKICDYFEPEEEK